jgi:protein SCO1/2
MKTTNSIQKVRIGLAPCALALLLGVWGASALAATQPAARQGTDILDNVGIDQKLDAQVPLDLEFRNETGQTVKLKDYFGDKPVILTLVYYECPMLCTQVLNGLLSTMRSLSFDAGKQYTVLTVSFDPRETSQLAAEKKKGYLSQYNRPGAAEGWHFLTGDKEPIKKLAAAVGFRYAWDEQNKQFAHAAGIMVLTPQGKVSRYFYGLEYAPRDLRLGLVEASQGKIGSLADQVLLYCYHYDAATGKYGLLVARVLQLAGGITVLGLATLVGIMLRAERNRKKT